jgi:hypothetical protein
MTVTSVFDENNGASGMIKILDGSCLSELGIVLKEPCAI